MYRNFLSLPLSHLSPLTLYLSSPILHANSKESTREVRSIEMGWKMFQTENISTWWSLRPIILSNKQRTNLWTSTSILICVQCNLLKRMAFWSPPSGAPGERPKAKFLGVCSEALTPNLNKAIDADLGITGVNSRDATLKDSMVTYRIVFNLSSWSFCFRNKSQNDTVEKSERISYRRRGFC